MIVTFDALRVASVLESTISSVFADLAFLDVIHLPPGQAMPSLAEGFDCVSVDVLKPVSMRIELKFTDALKKKVVDSLFDREEPNEGEDSLLEILNVVTGNFLTSYFGSDIEIKLELPEYLYSGECPDSSLIATTQLLVEGEPLEASVLSIRYHY